MTEINRQVALTAELVRQRLSMGDRADLAREVDHSAVFRRKAEAEAAAAELSALGYAVDVHRSWLRFVLEFAHVTTVDHGTAEAFTREVIPVIERHKGEYDGWGAMLEE